MHMNIERFQALCDGDPTRLHDLIDIYLTETSEEIANIKKAIKAKSASHVARIAHTMLGAHLMVGLESQGILLRDIEHQAGLGNMKATAISFERFEKEFVTLRAELIKTAIK